MIRWVIAAFLWASVAHAQVLSIPGVQQVGTITPGHVATWSGQLAIQDGGTAVTGVSTGPCLTSSTSSGSTFISGSNLVNPQTGLTYSVLGSDQCKLISISNAAAVTVTVPAAGTSTFTSGWMSCFQNRGAGAVTLSSASLIDAAGTLTFGQNSGVCLYTDGSTYYTQRGGAGLGTGTVTSVGLTSSNTAIFSTGANITLSGNLSFGLVTQAANTHLAGPTNGAAAIPTFRALTGADLPNPTTSQLGGIRAIAKVANQWLDAISTAGVPAQSQPSFSDLSGTLSPSQFPVLTGSVYNTLGSVTVTISDAAISTAMLQNSSVTNAKMANMSGGTFKGSTTTAAPSDLTASTILKTIGNTQGQILYRNIIDWVPLAAGLSGTFLSSQGANNNPIWAAVGAVFTGVNLQAITATGNYTPNPGMKYAVVFTTGGGGGGINTGGNDGGSGGGSAAGTAIGVFSAATIGASQSVTIGNGGSNGVSPANTTFGALLTGNAGANSISSAGPTPSAGATGGSASGGVLNIPGGDGAPGTPSDIPGGGGSKGSGGSGGSSFWGGGGKGGISGAAGSAAQAYGAGGGGGGGTGGGGAGKSGLVFVIEFM